MSYACPDADYIREAEMVGMPSPEPVCCPECGEECETVYVDASGYCFGCDKCLKARDAYDWFDERIAKEMSKGETEE